MAARITAAHNCIILDACCIINLYASNYMAEMFGAITEAITVATYVMSSEALTVYKLSKQAAPNERKAITLKPLVDNGLLVVVDLESEAEKIDFINFTSERLDDGEAATLALALNRGWAVATDDKAAVRLCYQRHIPLLTTPELVKHWADHARPSAGVLSQAVLNVEMRANYLLGKRNPLYRWWQLAKQAG